MHTPVGPRRSPALRVLNARWVDKSWIDNLPEHVPPAWYPRLDVPPTRADCPTDAPCPHVLCRKHLWLVEGRERPGRRTTQRQHVNGRFVPTSIGDTTGGVMPPSILRPASPTACALDVVDANPDGLDYDAIGRLLGVTGERVRQIAVAAARKLEDQGIALGEL